MVSRRVWTRAAMSSDGVSSLSEKRLQGNSAASMNSMGSHMEATTEASSSPGRRFFVYNGAVSRAGPNFLNIFRNTLVIGLLGLFISFPLSIVFALLLNEIHCTPFKKAVQTVSYMPYFISMVVICGLVTEFCSSRGIITDMMAAALDGASRLQRVIHVTLPCIMPTIVTMLILKCGTILGVGFEKIKSFSATREADKISFTSSSISLTVRKDCRMQAGCLDNLSTFDKTSVSSDNTSISSPP